MVATLLHAPAFASDVLANVAQVLFTQALLTDENTGPAITWGAGEHNGKIPPSLAVFRSALNLDGGNRSARWGLARAHLTLSDAASALELLYPLAERVDANPLLFLDFLVALSHGGEPAEVILMAESVPSLPPTSIARDIVALAYLQRSATGDLTRAYALRPGDLYINYQLSPRATDSGGGTEDSTFVRSLNHFPVEAIQPTDERLLEFTSGIIPHLLEEGIWDSGQTRNAVAFLVWQYHRLESTERLLAELMANDAAQADWPFYMAELQQRRGNLAQAEELYQGVLAIEPEYAEAVRRLALLCRSPDGTLTPTCSLHREAALYAAYLTLAPDDALAGAALSSICAEMEGDGTSNEVCRREAAPFSGEHLMAAEALGLNPDSVEIGPNRIQEFSADDAWPWATWIGGQEDGDGAFVGGPDEDDCRQGGHRVQGFWVDNPAGKNPARAGFYIGSQPIVVPAGATYLLSFYYRTEGLEDGEIRLKSRQQVPDQADETVRRVRLEQTGGAWHRFVLLDKSEEPDGPMLLKPFLLRSTGSGLLQFCDVQLSEVSVRG